MYLRHYIWLLYLAVGIALVAGVVILYRPAQANTNICDDKVCSEAKITQSVINMVLAVQTSNALPTNTSMPTNMTPIGDELTPPPLPPIVIRQVSDSDLTGPIFGNATSAWLVGVIASSDPYDSVGVFVLSYPPGDGAYSSIRYALNGRGASKDDQKKYFAYWFAPRDIGEIQITGVTGIDGIVSFKTSTGVIGTFDLATRTWSLK